MVDLSELRFQPLLPASLQGMYERAPRARSPSPERMADSPVPAAPPPAAAPRRREPPAEAGPRWTCDSCTLLNSASAKRCKACGAANPTLPAKPKRPKKEKPSKASVIMDDDDDGDPEDVHEYRYAGGLVPAAERGAARAPRARGGAAQQDRDRENSAREEERRREQAERDLQRERAERHREREGAGASQVGAVYQHRKSVPLPAPPLNMADDAPSIEAQIVGRGQFALHVREASEQGMVVVWCAPRAPLPLVVAPSLRTSAPSPSAPSLFTTPPTPSPHRSSPLPSPPRAPPGATPRQPGRLQRLALARAQALGSRGVGPPQVQADHQEQGLRRGPVRRAGRRLAPAAFPQPQPPPTPLPACPSSFTAADLKKLSDGNYAFALWATVNGLQSVMAMSTFFTLASGAPELPDDEALAAAAEEARRARGGGGGGGGGGRQRRRVWRRRASRRRSGRARRRHRARQRPWRLRHGGRRRRRAARVLAAAGVRCVRRAAARTAGWPPRAARGA